MITLSKVRAEVPALETSASVLKINGQVVWDYKDNEVHRQIRLIPSPIPSIDDPVTWKELLDSFDNSEEVDWEMTDEVSGEPIIRYAVTKKKPGDIFLEFFTF